MCDNHKLTDVVSGFYNDLSSKCSFKTRVNAENLSSTVNEIIDQLSDETMNRYYGSGLRIPENIEGKRVIDLGCGSGSLVFILSKLVGPTGSVVGVDITDGLVDSARQEAEYHWKKWGYEKSNMEFYCENIERLTELGMPEESFDIAVSNCVLCLCPNKDKIFEQACRMLKPNGMLLLSDVYAEVKPEDKLKDNPKLWCMGTAGAMLWNDLAPMVKEIGFTTPHLMSAGSVRIKSDECRKVLGNADYVCCEWRMFKRASEKSGPAEIVYQGNIFDNPNGFRWDIDLEFKKGQPMIVDGELAAILKSSSFADKFTFADHLGDDVKTKRNQNPYQHLKDLQSKGQTLKPRYTVD